MEGIQTFLKESPKKIKFKINVYYEKLKPLVTWISNCTNTSHKTVGSSHSCHSDGLLAWLSFTALLSRFFQSSVKHQNKLSISKTLPHILYLLSSLALRCTMRGSVNEPPLHPPPPPFSTCIRRLKPTPEIHNSFNSHVSHARWEFRWEIIDGEDRWPMRLQKPSSISFQPSLICYHPFFVTQQDLIKEKLCSVTSPSKGLEQNTHIYKLAKDILTDNRQTVVAVNQSVRQKSWSRYE